MAKAEPKSFIIVGAGIFGLSTALAIDRRHSSVSITIIDRLTPPVEDGTSVDTTRCIRADYGDPIYARLAADAQKLLEEDSELRPFYFKQGMTFVYNGEPGRFQGIWENGLQNVKKTQSPETLVEMPTSSDVFSRIHGSGSTLVPDSSLRRPRQWNMGYCNLEDAFIDAKGSIEVYYRRCLAQKNIKFMCGVPVREVQTDMGVAQGVILEDGRELSADVTLAAAGAWSNKLVYLEGLTYSSAIEVAWVRVTDEEARKWKDMSITTNLSTGFNIFPPYQGEIKMLRRSPGYCNTVSVPHPEERSKTMSISYPRTTVTNPTDIIPVEAEIALRENLTELMPSLADRPFDRTKLCWLSQTPTADFIISPHPRIKRLHVATGGSAHAWKFLPIIGDLVLDSIHGTLDPILAQKWQWGKTGSDGGNAPRMEGTPKELRNVVRSGPDSEN